MGIEYSDLLGLRRSKGGARNTAPGEGIDCYGLVVECCRRQGVRLKDPFKGLSRFHSDEVVVNRRWKDVIKLINCKRAPGPDEGVIFFNRLTIHLGYCLDKEHALAFDEEGKVAVIDMPKSKYVLFFVPVDFEGEDNSPREWDREFRRLAKESARPAL